MINDGNENNNNNLKKNNINNNNNNPNHISGTFLFDRSWTESASE